MHRWDGVLLDIDQIQTRISIDIGESQRCDIRVNLSVFNQTEGGGGGVLDPDLKNSFVVTIRGDEKIRAAVSIKIDKRIEIWS